MPDIELTRRQALKAAGGVAVGAGAVGEIGEFVNDESSVQEVEAASITDGIDGPVDAALGASTMIPGFGSFFVGVEAYHAFSDYIDGNTVDTEEVDQLKLNIEKSLTQIAEQSSGNVAYGSEMNINKTEGTLADIRTIVGLAADGPVFSAGKIEGIDAINEGKSQDIVRERAVQEVEERWTIVRTNLISAWNEVCQVVDSWTERVLQVDGIENYNVFLGPTAPNAAENDSYLDFISNTLSGVEQPDGSTSQEIQTIGLSDNSALGHAYLEWSPVSITNKYTGINDDSNVRFVYDAVDSTGQEYHVELGEFAIWSGVLDYVDEEFSRIKTDVATWVDEVYPMIQSGEVSIDEIMTPYELALFWAEDESAPYTLAQLVSLNAPTALTRNVHVKLHDLEMWGALAVGTEQTIEAGVQYDPSNVGPVYLTYDVSRVSGTWTDFEAPIDGGTVTFTRDPYDGFDYTIETNKDESVTVAASEFTQSSETTWTYNASGDLESDVAEIVNVDVETRQAETVWETVNIRDPFTVVEITNEETGENVDSADYDKPAQTHDTGNYVTQEQWDIWRQKQEEIIDNYPSEDTSPSPGGVTLPDGVPEWAVYAGGGAAAVLALLGLADGGGR